MFYKTNIFKLESQADSHHPPAPGLAQNGFDVYLLALPQPLDSEEWTKIITTYTVG